MNSESDRRFQILAVPPANCVTLGRSLYNSEPQFSQCVVGTLTPLCRAIVRNRCQRMETIEHDA